MIRVWVAIWTLSLSKVNLDAKRHIYQYIVYLLYSSISSFNLCLLAAATILLLMIFKNFNFKRKRFGKRMTSFGAFYQRCNKFFASRDCYFFILWTLYECYPLPMFLLLKLFTMADTTVYESLTIYRSLFGIATLCRIVNL